MWITNGDRARQPEGLHCDNPAAPASWGHLPYPESDRRMSPSQPGTKYSKQGSSISCCSFLPPAQQCSPFKVPDSHSSHSDCLPSAEHLQFHIYHATPIKFIKIWLNSKKKLICIPVHHKQFHFSITFLRGKKSISVFLVRYPSPLLVEFNCQILNCSKICTFTTAFR